MRGVAAASGFALRLTAAATLACAAASPAAAQWTAFLPTPYANHVWLESYSSYERDYSRSNRRDLEWEDVFLRQRIGFSSLGYSYDPRFLQYKLSIAGAFRQEDYQLSSASSAGGWTTEETIEYDARLHFLPEHHYNGQVFASRYQPIYPRQSLTQHSSYVDEYGADLRYRLKPWFFDSNYLDSTLHQVGNESNIKRLNVDTEYFWRFHDGYELSVSGTARPSWYDDSLGLDGTAYEYAFNSFVNLKHVRLDSSVSDNNFEQDRNGFDRYDTDQFGWWEQMSVYLPWNFRTDVTWRLYENDSTYDRDDLTDERRYSNDGHTLEVEEIHRLYESVDTRYRFAWDNRDSNQASSDAWTHSLSVDYTKQIPWGQLLTGGSYGNSKFENRGFASVINDPYAATAIPGTIALRQQNVEEDTILVQLKSPIPPFEVVTLVEGVHYQVNTAVEPFEIQIVNLPAEFVVPASYDIFLTYTLLGGDYDLGIDTGAASFELDLFNHLVSPFFRYLAQRSDVLSGVYPGIPIDSDSYNAGVRLEYGPWRGRGEFLYLDWAANPYRLWRAEVQYVGNLPLGITSYANATYINRHYLGGEAPYNTEERTEETETLSATLSRQFWQPDLTLSVGASWSHLSGITDGNAWSTHSSLVWRIGKLDVSFGVSAYGSTSDTTNAPDFERDHEMIYLSLRRQIL